MFLDLLASLFHFIYLWWLFILSNLWQLYFLLGYVLKLIYTPKKEQRHSGRWGSLSWLFPICSQLHHQGSFSPSKGHFSKSTMAEGQEKRASQIKDSAKDSTCKCVYGSVVSTGVNAGVQVSVGSLVRSQAEQAGNGLGWRGGEDGWLRASSVRERASERGCLWDMGTLDISLCVFVCARWSASATAIGLW